MIRKLALAGAGLAVVAASATTVSPASALGYYNRTDNLASSKATIRSYAGLGCTGAVTVLAIGKSTGTDYRQRAIKVPRAAAVTQYRLDNGDVVSAYTQLAGCGTLSGSNYRYTVRVLS